MNGFEVRMRRLEAGLKQYELAARLHITQTVLSEIELGKRPLTTEMEARILSSLQRDVESKDGKDERRRNWPLPF
jgi:transcriptional regulator with XRE-family HTH domain